MIWTIYGLRIRDDKEVRYVGQTQSTPHFRLQNHQWAARKNKTALAEWLRDNGDRVEIFPIAKVDQPGKAAVYERLIITLCVALGHRLFNRGHVPAHLRIANPAEEAA